MPAGRPIERRFAGFVDLTRVPKARMLATASVSTLPHGRLACNQFRCAEDEAHRSRGATDEQGESRFTTSTALLATGQPPHSGCCSREDFETYPEHSSEMENDVPRSLAGLP